MANPPLQLTRRDLEWLFAAGIITIVSLTLLIYEYLLTFSSEVETFWPESLKQLIDPLRRRHNSKPMQLGKDARGEAAILDSDGKGSHTRRRGFSWASLLFFSNRYLVLLGNIPSAVVYYFGIHGSSDNHMKICSELKLYQECVSVVVQIIVAILMFMWVYALYERRVWVAALYATIVLALSAFALWVILNSRLDNASAEGIPKLNTCASPLSRKVAIYMIIGWSGESLFDALVLGMTLYKTLTMAVDRRVELLSMLLRDGTLYFAVMTLINVANIMSYSVNLGHRQAIGRGSVVAFKNAISSIMMSRLMLNLRGPKLHSQERGAAYDDASTAFGFNPGNNGLHSRPELMTSVGVGLGEE